MMRVPSFRRVLTAIPAVSLLALVVEAAKVKKALKTMYRDMGGNRAARAFAHPTIGGLRDSIREVAEKEAWGVFTELDEKNPVLASYRDADGLHISCRINYEYGKPDQRRPEILLYMEIWRIYIFHAGVLASLESDRPQVYQMLRIILNFLRGMPCCTPDFWNEMIKERSFEFDMEEEAQEEFDCKGAQEEADLYKKHVSLLKGSDKYLLAKLKGLHRRYAYQLSDTENWFVRTAIQLMEAYLEVDFKILVHDDPYEDRNDVFSFFTFAWQDKGAISEYASREYEYYNQSGPPALIARLTGERDLIKAKALVRCMILYEALMEGGDTIWSS